MDVIFSLGDYPFKPQAANLIKQILIEHPLREDILSLQDIDSITIDINLQTGMFHRDDTPEINYREFPKVIALYFGRDRYLDADTQSFKSLLFKKDMFHEFTHLIDSRNGAFGFTFKKRDAALKLEKQLTQLGSWSILYHLWNCYIDGRLRRRGICVKTWEERYDEIGERRRCRLGAKAIDTFRRAYEQDSLTFDNLLELQKECIDQYQIHQSEKAKLYSDNEHP